MQRNALAYRRADRQPWSPPTWCCLAEPGNQGRWTELLTPASLGACHMCTKGWRCAHCTSTAAHTYVSTHPDAFTQHAGIPTKLAAHKSELLLHTTCHNQSTQSRAASTKPSATSPYCQVKGDHRWRATHQQCHNLVARPECVLTGGQ